MSQPAKKPAAAPKIIGEGPVTREGKALLVVAAAICKLCDRPILPRDVGSYAGEVTHRVCGLEARMEDAEKDINRLHVEIDRLTSQRVH